MVHYFSVIVLFCLIFSIEATIGPGNRKASPRASEKVVSTPSPTVQSPPPSSPSVQSSPPVKTNVLQRKLVEENTNPRSILENHESYCSTCLETREFTHSTLVYITPWNAHGYDIAKTFTKKFDYISPVWLSIKRTSVEKYVIEGTHDIDKKWIEVLKENNPKVRIVPRVIFEKWSVDDVHALFESEDEKQQLATTFANFLIEYKDFFDGYVIELLMQFRGASKPTLNHIVSDIAERVHQIDDNGKKKEVILAVPPYEELFDKNDFELLYDHLDGFSIMTYDFPNREPGPVAPLEWVETTMETFSKPQGEAPVKVFLGLNFYGYRYDRVDSPAKKNQQQQQQQQQQYEMKPIVGRDYIDFLKKSHSTSAIIYDPRVREHVTVIQTRPTKQQAQQQQLPQTIIFYPSLQSIYERLELATKLNVGIAIWDGGQDFDFFKIDKPIDTHNMVGQFIDTFWRKSFIGDLRRARKISEDDTQWTLVYNGKAHQFQFVWLQGLCIKIDKNADTMIIEDATGQAEIPHYSRISDARSASEGDFTMIAGRLLNTNSSDRIVVEIYKFQCFKTSSKLELNWPFEIVDISQRIYH